MVGNAFNHRNKARHNPKGYWELEVDEWYWGLDRKYDDKVIKLFAEGLEKLEPERIEKAIVCDRDYKSVAKSFKKLLDDNPDFPVRPTKSNLEKIYRLNKSGARNYLTRNKIPYKVIKLDKFRKSPDVVLYELAEFVGYKGNITEAIVNVDRRDKPWA